MTITAGHLFGERYRLERELGSGGMGSVWLSRDERLGRDVAVKVMSVRLANNPEACLRFEREAMAVARVSSPHIVQIYDFGTQPQAFMVMELLRGESLSQRLKREKTLAPLAVTDLVMQCARGLATAHDAGIVHRDLKPGNIFIARERDRDLFKIVDFGLAKAFRGNATLANITEVGEASGTPIYMSPEQLGAIEDHRDDVWSFAVIAYRCLSGAHPFEGSTMVELVQSVLNEPHVPITSRDRRLPSSLDVLFARAFYKHRDARFQSIHEFTDAITALLDAKPHSETSAPDTLPDLRPHDAAMLSAYAQDSAPTVPRLQPSAPSVTNATVVSALHTVEQIPAVHRLYSPPFANPATVPNAHPVTAAQPSPASTFSGCLRTFFTFVVGVPLGLLAIVVGIQVPGRFADGELAEFSGIFAFCVLVVLPGAVSVFLFTSWLLHRRAARVRPPE